MAATSLDELQALLPCLPDDVALQCLLRVPFQSLPRLQRVCRRWRDLITSSEFHVRRTKQHSLCLLEALPTRTHPLFSIRLLNADPLPQPPDPGVPLFARLATTGSLLLLLGGWHPTTMAALRSVLIYSFASRTWRRGADMPRPRSFFACTTLPGGDVVVAGGHDTEKNALQSADVYNAREDAWSALPDMGVARDECTSVVLGEKLVVLGGYTTSSQGQFRSDSETLTSSWTPRPIHSDSKSSLSHFVAFRSSLFAIRDGEVVCYSPEGNSWRVVDVVPDAIASVSSATGFGDGIFVTAQCGDGAHRVFVYRLRSKETKGRWETVSADEHLGGVVHGSCVVEV